MRYRALEPITIKMLNEQITIPVGEILVLTANQAAKLRGKITAEDHAPPPLPEPPIRQWIPGHPFTCACGEPTGWTTDGVGICPSCEFGPNDPPPATKPKN